MTLFARLMGRAKCPGWLLAVSLLALPARAEEPAEPAQENAWKFQVTNQASAIVNGDNRDTRAGDVTTRANDHFSLLNNRLDTQASGSGLVLSLRLDSLWFMTRPDPTQIALDMVEEQRASGGPPPGAPSEADFFRLKVLEAGSELSNRHINWIVPAKYAATYQFTLGGNHTQKSYRTNIKTTFGDFYSQMGRRFVLSVRKQDALSSDTTLRGARLDTASRVQKTRIETTLLTGTGNPLRIDEASGRYLGVDTSAMRGLQYVTEAGMPRAIDTDFARLSDCVVSATCSYAPDDLYAAQLQIAPPGFKLASQASLLQRHTFLSADIIRSAQRIVTASQSLEFADILGHTSLYVEGASQHRQYPESHSLDRQRLDGHALYVNADMLFDVLQLTFEGKHYRAFYPLSAGVHTARAPQFNQVQYSQVPTAEPFWNTSQFENFNTCVTGGRTQVDLPVSNTISVFAWAGRFYSWAESVANENCEVRRENLNRVWDFSTGTEISSTDHRSRSQLSIGVRDDVTPYRELGGGNDQTNVFYREAYTRYDALFHVSGPYSLQFQGWHRYRRQTIGGPQNPWAEGQHLSALEVAPFGNIALGIEYDTNPITPDIYFNGQLTYRIDSASNLTLFAGQRRGMQRCIAGVCRVFPPFEGARLDFTLRL